MAITLAKTDRVVRSKGDYVVGRTGTVIDIDETNQRAQVDWDRDPKSWVSFGSLELEATPYEILPGTHNKKTGRYSNPKYIRK